MVARALLGCFALLLGACDDATDGPADAAVDSGGPSADAGGRAVGTRLATGDLQAVTADGHVVFSDATAYYVVPMTGGAPIKIADVRPGAVSVLRVRGDLVALWPSASVSAALWVWTAATGSTRLSDTSRPGLIEASPDGATIMYTTHAGSRIDVVVSSPTGAELVPLATGMAEVALGGWCLAGATLYPVVATRTALDTDFEIAAFDSSSAYARSVLVTGSGPIALSLGRGEPGPYVVFPSGAGEAMVASVEGGPPRLIEADVLHADVSRDGRSVVYVTGGEALRRSPLDVIAPTTLVTSGVAYDKRLLSPDSTSLLYWRAASPSGLELALAPAEVPGEPFALVGSAMGMVAVDFPEFFTADSAYAFYPNVASHDLLAMPVTGGTEPLTLGHGVPLASHAADGSRVVFVDEATGMPPIGRLRVADLSIAGAPAFTTIVDGASAKFLVAPSLHAVVYAWGPDLYAAPIP